MNPDKITGKHAGAFGELKACAWLLKQGYDVYRNVSPFGLADIIAVRGQERMLLDVKLVGDKTRGRKLSQAQIAAGILPLYVYTDGCCKIGFTTLIDISAD
jgi:hypothetical protein